MIAFGIVGDVSMIKYGYIVPDDYKGCMNCVHLLEECHPEEQDGRMHIICPRWEKKEDKE